MAWQSTDEKSNLEFNEVVLSKIDCQKSIETLLYFAYQICFENNDLFSSFFVMLDGIAIFRIIDI